MFKFDMHMSSNKLISMENFIVQVIWNYVIDVGICTQCKFFLYSNHLKFLCNVYGPNLGHHINL